MDNTPQAENWQWWQLIGITIGLFWVSLLAHEGAHFATLELLRSTLGAKQWTVWTRAIAPMAGPLATLTIVVSCAALALRTSSNRRTLLAWALATGAASRIVLLAPVVVFGRGVNDETTVANAFHVPAGLVWGAEFAIAAPAIMIIYRRLSPSDRTRSLRWIPLGVVVGWVSAFTVGPMLGLPI